MILIFKFYSEQLTCHPFLGIILAPMAVVVQEMVDADSAGVLFSRDPVTGNQSQIVITANYGLGEVCTCTVQVFYKGNFF